MTVYGMTKGTSQMLFFGRDKFTRYSYAPIIDALADDRQQIRMREEWYSKQIKKKDIDKTVDASFMREKWKSFSS